MEAEERCSTSSARTRAKPTAPLPSEADQSAEGASKWLSDLPSRGLFSSTVLSTNLEGTRVYVCEHDTTPPEAQLIKTNTTNILIRALQMSKQKNDMASKAIVERGTGKRSAPSTSEGRTPAKKLKTSLASCSSHEGSRAVYSEKTLQTMTVEKLRILLKDRGLPLKGRKDELIARLKDQ